MYIRKYTIFFIIILLIISISSILIYQQNMRNAVTKVMIYEDDIGSFTKVKDKNIQIYTEDGWRDFTIKGIQLSSFTPGYARNKSNVEKEDVLLWLKQISELNANVITIPNIQPPAFYNAIYDFNLDAEKPIYLIHEIPLDERAMLRYYDAYKEEIIKPLKKDIKNTIDAVHGNGLVLDNSRHHMGVYLKDVSAYIVGYVIGTNTNAELVTLTNLSHSNTTSYNGVYYNVEEGTSFECFIAEMMDYCTSYEVEKYHQLSLISYLTSIDTDSLSHKNETNVTKNSSIHIENIKAIYANNIFASYSAHPNAVDFLDYEYAEEDSKEDSTSDKYYFYKYLCEINNFHTIPTVITDIGLPSSRGMSKIDEDDGFNRGNLTEKEQGEMLIELLKDIYRSGFVGAVINAWQDDWGRPTAFNLVEDYSDKNASTYWFDAQASDESFGLMAFESGEKENICYIDGNINEWENIKPIINEKGIELRAQSDTSYLYLMLKKEKWSMAEDKMYIGLDVTPLSGSTYWENTGAKFEIPVDFIVELIGYNESRIVVNERYNLFNYLYKYYSNVIEKQDKAPAKDSDVFSAIYLLNRKRFYFRESNTIILPAYYQTGRLVYGNGNPKDNNYNSLTDFNKQGDVLEIRIPWMLINIKNPLRASAQDDFYSKGLESQININSIGISVYCTSDSEDISTGAVNYMMPRFKNMKYHQRLKDSYKIIQRYWEANPRL